MDRRIFLKYNILSLATITSLYSEQKHSNHNMSMPMPNAHGGHSNVENMHGGHSNAVDMDSGVNIDTSFISLENPNIKLLDEKEFQSGKELQKLKLLKNTSNKKNLFRSTLEIKKSHVELVKGKKTACFTYNGSFIGPKIEVYEGDTVEILVKNNLDEPTTIHWHGLDIPPEQDGNPHDPILPGRERVYRFNLKENSAGTYWYHPHPHYTTSKQVYKGLAGALVVKAKKDALSHLKEQDWLIRDLRLDEHGQIPDNNLYDWLNGREGELVLINGQLKPKITINDEQRIRIYNLCSARYLNLRIKGAKFVVVGSDGGLLEKAQEQDELFLSPASRAEVIIKATNGNFKLENTYYNRDKMLIQEQPYDYYLADIKVEKTIDIPNNLRKIPSLGEATSFKEVIFSEDHNKLNNIENKDPKTLKQDLASMFLLNGKVFDMNRIDLHSKLGEVEEWTIKNNSHMDHNFHIHGTQFQVVSYTTNNETTMPKFRALQDTINVKPNQIIKIKMVQNFKGLRMFHCHILEHEDLGMMGILKVE